MPSLEVEHWSRMYWLMNFVATVDRESVLLLKGTSIGRIYPQSTGCCTKAARAFVAPPCLPDRRSLVSRKHEKAVPWANLRAQ